MKDHRKSLTALRQLDTLKCCTMSSSTITDTDLPTPEYFCHYSKQHVSYFQIFYMIFIFFRMHHQTIKTKKCQTTIFLSFILQDQCKNSHFFIIQTHYKTSPPWHSDGLFCLHLLKLFRIKDCIFEKHTCTSLLPADFNTNTVKYGWIGRSVDIYLDTVKGGHKPLSTESRSERLS